MANTPTVHCPRCDHSINHHHADNSGCSSCGNCVLDPNTIAVAAVHTALFGELTKPTPPAPHRISRNADGSWD